MSSRTVSCHSGHSLPPRIRAGTAWPNGYRTFCLVVILCGGSVVRFEEVLMRQAGLFGFPDHLRKLSATGDPLGVLAKVVDFEIFRAPLEAALGYSDGLKLKAPRMNKSFDAVRYAIEVGRRAPRRPSASPHDRRTCSRPETGPRLPRSPGGAAKAVLSPSSPPRERPQPYSLRGAPRSRGGCAPVM